ncbi:substrate-binding domain-containing protein [Clavibacter zhangzhiyongii]|uniref:substrate-binding domain-containing protein n=1 Tax=Clavibacter zhangzhiyongii TaxID=2768071 RepID=UPI0039DF34EB
MAATVVRAAAPTAEAAAAATERIVARPRTTDAIVAFNDVCALGVLSACRRAGVDVPGDVRVAGIDGLSIGRLLAPTLTTLAVDLDELARHALDLAVAMIAGSSRAPARRWSARCGTSWWCASRRRPALVRGASGG